MLLDMIQTQVQNKLVVQVGLDLQIFRPEFRALHSIMRQMWPHKQPFMTLRDIHTLNFVISTTVYVVDMIPRLNLDQHR